MADDLIAKASILVNAQPEQVWDALTDPVKIREYMFGANVVSDWRVGSPIVWKGDWEGKPYEDKGVILALTPNRTIAYTHFSPLGGKQDLPENYHRVTVNLSPRGKQTEVSITQDNNTDEKARDHSAKNWETMLAGLKKVVER